MSHHQRGSLYVVATPIGNLKDITLRALDILSQADLILSEHVRKTRNLLRHYSIKTRVCSYREQNSRRVVPAVIGLLGKGDSVALVSEAGTPGLSDPGRHLVEAVRQEGFKVVPVPGASAAVAAICVSGMDEPCFAFEGFLPRRRSRRRQRLREIASDRRQLVFFEAPHRLVEFLQDVRDVLGDRRCLVAREITKLHEDIDKGTVSGFLEKYQAIRPRGEFVIVCEGLAEKDVVRRPDRILDEAAGLLSKGFRKTEVAKALARKHGIKARDIYRLITRGSEGTGKEEDSEG